MPCTVPSGSICRWNPVLQYSCLLRRIPWRCVRSVLAPRDSRSPEMSGSPSSEPELSPKGVSTKWEPTCGIPSIPRTLPTSPRTAADATAIVLEAERVKFREEVLRKRLAYFATCLSPTACLPPASSGTRTHAGKKEKKKRILRSRLRRLG